MVFIKKMCVLRQVKQGFSGDGKPLTGLIKAEQYGKNISVEVSVVGFAPLSSGEYYCILADCHLKTELLPLRGKSLFNIVSDLDLSGGFCGVICFVKNEIVPIAYGVNGNRTYDFKQLVKNVLPKAEEEASEESYAFAKQEQPPSRYDDEQLSSVNYYMQENVENERFESTKGTHHVRVEDSHQTEIGATGENAAADENAQNVLHPFATDTDGYYVSVRSEIDELFKNNPKDERLCDVFPSSEWVKIAQNEKEFLVGVVYEELKAKYVCYALPAENAQLPPEEIKDVCVFIPTSSLEGASGFFVIFQSAATGECIKPKSI